MLFVANNAAPLCAEMSRGIVSTGPSRFAHWKGARCSHRGISVTNIFEVITSVASFHDPFNANSIKKPS